MIYSFKVFFKNKPMISRIYYSKKKAIEKLYDGWLNQENYDYIEIKNIITRKVIKKITPCSGVIHE